MSLKDKKEITDRIWQHSQARSLGKMLLLALVEAADADGFCYPSQETLGKMIGLKGEQKTIQRNTFHHVAPLIKSGEIISWEQQGRKGGRGYTNIYLIAVGLTDEQIRERVQRRFKLFDDELDAAITQTGEIYARLCADRRIAADKLDLTNPEAQKPPKFDATEEEKPPKNDALNPDKTVKSSPPSPQDSKKVVKFGGRTESPNQESNPDKESKELSPKQKLFLVLADLCHIELRAASEKQKGQLGNVSRTLVNLVMDIDQFKVKFPAYWAAMDWRGKKGQSPEPPQIQEAYGDYCHWLKNGEKVTTELPKNGANHYGSTYQRSNQKSQLTGESLDDKPTHDPNTDEYVYPDGHREPVGTG